MTSPYLPSCGGECASTFHWVGIVQREITEIPSNHATPRKNDHLFLLLFICGEAEMEFLGQVPRWNEIPFYRGENKVLQTLEITKEIVRKDFLDFFWWKRGNQTHRWAQKNP